MGGAGEGAPHLKLPLEISVCLLAMSRKADITALLRAAMGAC